VEEIVFTMEIKEGVINMIILAIQIMVLIEMRIDLIETKETTETTEVTINSTRTRMMMIHIADFNVININIKYT